MASFEHVKLLVNAHFDGDERFKTVALQIAASEASKGHVTIARDIRKIIQIKSSAKPITNLNESTDLMICSSPKIKLSNLVVNDITRNRLSRIIEEYKQKDKIRKFGLENRRKILLCGRPGTGKTMTASVLATELNMPLYTIMLDKMISKYMGETANKLRQIFETIRDFPGVYLFYEFDAIGGERTKENDIGEIRRVLNSFLQFIEQDNSNSLIIAATNNSQMLDYALFRRFDDIIQYELPEKEEIINLLENKLCTLSDFNEYNKLAEMCFNLSHAEITKACNDFIKACILNEKNATVETFRQLIDERIKFIR